MTSTQVPNPVPRVAHPDWLQARLVEQHDPMKQRSIKEASLHSADNYLSCYFPKEGKKKKRHKKEKKRQGFSFDRNDVCKLI